MPVPITRVDCSGAASFLAKSGRSYKLFPANSAMHISGIVPCCDHLFSLGSGELRVAVKKSRTSLRYSLA